MKAGGPLSEALPRGFEIYESPRGQVLLRKILPKLISDDELATVKRELARIACLEGSLVERKLEILTVNVVDRKEDLMKDLRGLLPWGRLAHIDQAPEDIGLTMRNFNSCSLTTAPSVSISPGRTG